VRATNASGWGGSALSTATEQRRATRAGAADGPEDLGGRDWLGAFKLAGKAFLKDDCMGLAQQVAYSALLAFFPAAVLLVGLLGLIGAYDQLEQLLGAVAPKAVLQALQIAQGSANGSGKILAVVLGTAGALWAATGAMGSIVKAVNRAYELEGTRGFVKQKLTSALLVLAAGTVLAGLFLLIVFGGPLGDAIARRAGLGGAFTTTWAILRWPIAFAAILLLLALIYYAAPNRTPRNWKWITPGSLVGAVLWLALSGLFALYTSFSHSYDRTYGTLAGAIVLLLWLYYSALALLFGAELNAELERRGT
jgi:membrane protein